MLASRSSRVRVSYYVELRIIFENTIKGTPIDWDVDSLGGKQRVDLFLELLDRLTLRYYDPRRPLDEQILVSRIFT